MNSYIGVKSIKAKAMTLGEYNVYRGWDMPENENPAAEGFLVEYEQDPKSPNKNHPDHEGYISWSPKVVFEKAYVTKSLIPLDNILPNVLAPHQERVVTEYNDLLTKSIALESFLQGDFYKTLPEDEQLRLSNQNTVMHAYLSILNQRIKNF